MSANGVAIDCGAGWGRITENVLSKRFKTIDLVEPSSKQINKARKLLQWKVRQFYQQGLQEFQFTFKYDCIWIQWCLCYLTDDDCLEFLKRARDSLV